jgi:hypothetical protein
MQNITENYSVEITTSTASGSITKAMAESMQRTKDLVTRRMLRDMLWGARPEGVNEIVHGIKPSGSDQTIDGIHRSD